MLFFDVTPIYSNPPSMKTFSFARSEFCSGHLAQISEKKWNSLPIFPVFDDDDDDAQIYVFIKLIHHAECVIQGTF